jgi:uncharacterized protein
METKMAAIESFTKQNYINLETLRKNGVSVKTPVWFVQEADTLFVRTVANSGKVKRIRNNSQVNIAPCTGNGSLLGEWVSAQATENTDKQTDIKVDQLLGKKYGLMKSMFDLLAKFQGRKNTVLEIHLESV